MLILRGEFDPFWPLFTRKEIIAADIKCIDVAPMLPGKHNSPVMSSASSFQPEQILSCFTPLQVVDELFVERWGSNGANRPRHPRRELEKLSVFVSEVKTNTKSGELLFGFLTMKAKDNQAVNNDTPATKLLVPHLREDLVPRDRLLKLLNRSSMGRLTLVSAPAGFGKTTLVSSWINNQDVPVAWVSLDDGGDDYAHFWTS